MTCGVIRATSNLNVAPVSPGFCSCWTGAANTCAGAHQQSPHLQGTCSFCSDSIRESCTCRLTMTKMHFFYTKPSTLTPFAGVLQDMIKETNHFPLWTWRFREGDAPAGIQSHLLSFLLLNKRWKMKQYDRVKSYFITANVWSEVMRLIANKNSTRGENITDDSRVWAPRSVDVNVFILTSVLPFQTLFT